MNVKHCPTCRCVIGAAERPPANADDLRLTNTGRLDPDGYFRVQSVTLNASAQVPQTTYVTYPTSGTVTG